MFPLGRPKPPAHGRQTATHVTPWHAPTPPDLAPPWPGPVADHGPLSSATAVPDPPPSSCRVATHRVGPPVPSPPLCSDLVALECSTPLLCVRYLHSPQKVLRETPLHPTEPFGPSRAPKVLVHRQISPTSHHHPSH
jgi:hypothetical protein